jgi:hypothetical protein
METVRLRGVLLEWEVEGSAPPTASLLRGGALMPYPIQAWVERNWEHAEYSEIRDLQSWANSLKHQEEMLDPTQGYVELRRETALLIFVC